MGVAVFSIAKEDVAEDTAGWAGKERMFIVPCISRIARPDGVWRRVGRGLVVPERVTGERCSGIVGMISEIVVDC